MFGTLENTQKEVSSLLESLVSSGEFPNALLFSGSPCTGRMFASRLVCKELGIPDDNVLIVSDRNHAYRIRTAISLFEKQKNSSSKRFLKDNVSILLQQYHGALIDSQSTTAGKKKFSDAAEVSDILRDLDNADEKNADAICEKLSKALSPLLDSNRTSAISIGQVRAIRDWCSTSSMDGQGKMVIIEGLENAGDSAVNGLLKTLEEPPEGCRFILISANAGRIPATILSRVQKIRFSDLDDNKRAYILNSLFVDPKKYSSLEEFFLEGSGINDSLLLESAQNLLDKKEVDLPALIAELEKNQGWDRFFEHVINQISKSFAEGKLDERRASYLLNAVSEAVSKGRVFNQTKRLTFDYVFYRVKEVNR